MELLNKKQFKKFSQAIDCDLEDCFAKLESKKDIDFEYMFEASAVFSSNIEGNTMDLNSFMNLKTSKDLHKAKEFEEIFDLKEAYEFARENELTENNLLKTHKMLSKLFMSPGNRGKYRQDKVGVFSSIGLVYMAIEYEYVSHEMKQLFSDIKELLEQELTTLETFYFASQIHLIFAHIHPFMDGNGRVARLLEKWFLASKLGKKAWAIESERYYKEHLGEYYKNINLGPNYYEVDYSKSNPFLLMLAKSICE